MTIPINVRNTSVTSADYFTRPAPENGVISVTFGSTDTSRSFTLKANLDGSSDDNEKVRFTIGSPLPSQVIARSPTRTDVTIGNAVRADPTVCHRTDEVETYILALGGTASDCRDVTKSQLAAITAATFNLEDSTTSLKSGDFNDLTGLTSLGLQDNNLSSLPADLFDDNTKLTTLDLDDNNFSTLPDGIFEELTALSTLDLSGNPGTFGPTVSLESGGTSGIGDNVIFTPRLDGGPWGENVIPVWDQVTALNSTTAATENTVTINNRNTLYASFTGPSVTAANSPLELFFRVSVYGRGTTGPTSTAWVQIDIVHEDYERPPGM